MFPGLRRQRSWLIALLAFLLTMSCAGTQDSQPVWSPDGSQIAFVYSPGVGDYDVYVMNADGSARNRLEDGRCPVWSPDGSQIAFVLSRGGIDLGVYVMNANGSEQRRLAGVSGLPGRLEDGYCPVWSPDGTRILYGNLRNTGTFTTTWDLFLANVDGSGRAPLLQDIERAYARWSPDGSKLVLSYSPKGALVGDVYVVNADGGNRTRIVPNGLWPIWSPDGKWIAFERRGIHIVRADGSTLLSLTDAGSYSAPVWSPDGTRIAVVLNGAEIYVVNRDGSHQTLITQEAADEVGLGDLGWSPDGNRLVFTKSTYDAPFRGPSVIFVANADGSGLTSLSSDRGVRPVTFFLRAWGVLLVIIGGLAGFLKARGFITAHIGRRA